MGAGDSSSFDSKKKLYNAMESDDGSDPRRHIDKGKGIDKSYTESGGENEAKFLDKGKGIDRTVHPIRLGPGHSIEPPFVT